MSGDAFWMCRMFNDFSVQESPPSVFIADVLSKNTPKKKKIWVQWLDKACWPGHVQSACNKVSTNSYSHLVQSVADDSASKYILGIFSDMRFGTSGYWSTANEFMNYYYALWIIFNYLLMNNDVNENEWNSITINIQTHECVHVWAHTATWISRLRPTDNW